jgi:arylsulfatase A-like enzyme
VLHWTAIAGRVVDGIQEVESVCTDVLGVPLLKSPADRLRRLFGKNRKEAAVVNQEFLDWLSARRPRDRPFFAFLNFFDAHYPYQLPATGIHRFGAVLRNDRERAVIRDSHDIQKHGLSPRLLAFARDSYDECVADLDERLGELIDELERRAVLDRTWVIVTADHGESFGEHPTADRGESFGEHPRVFLHGTSVYQTESHVPLVVIPPGGAVSPQVVTEPVSLRDLAATIIDISGIKDGSSFPGCSLARFWGGPSAVAASDQSCPSPALCELSPESPLNSDPDLRRTDIRLWPVAAIIDGNWSYTRREGDLFELLFNLREDAGELRNLANDPAMRPILERMRKALGQLTDGPLTPDRFNP